MPAALYHNGEEGKGTDGEGASAEATRAVTRQDHPSVRAIRLTEEDWREVDLAKAGASTLEFGVLRMPGGVQDEEVYISQLQRRAALLNDEFQMCVQRAVERRFGDRVEFHSAPVKTKGRMREKLQGYAAPSQTSSNSSKQDDKAEDADEQASQLPLAANILDPIRTTLVCGGAAEMLEVVEWLVAEGAVEGLAVVRVKNKFAAKDASEYDGYRDLMVSVMYTGSHNLNIIGEIQIHDFRLHALKLQMHKLYKVKRATRATLI